ncbi:hypothetical protein [Olivibacter sp. XZL3]|uniref:hypothetical protein n=1 Tax=Olivibacter sp. XZL3 TaxID=1735116 RepID=UPI001F0DF55B|nr:hypothetical protein [Olivibacter sp. XZL3]
MKTSVSPARASSEKLPLPSVVVPFAGLFFTLTLTPGMGTCCASVTVPFTVCCRATACCCAPEGILTAAMDGAAARLQSNRSPALESKGFSPANRLPNRFCKYISNHFVL